MSFQNIYQRRCRLHRNFTPFLFSGINSWEKALKSPKIQAYFRCNTWHSVASSSPNHDINDFDGIPRKFGVVYIQFSIFIQNSMGEKRGETGYIFIHKKMLLKFPFSAFTLSKLNATIFFCSIQVHKSFLGRIFSNLTVKCCEMYRVFLSFFFLSKRQYS